MALERLSEKFHRVRKSFQLFFFLADKYLSYLTTPFVIFLKDKLSQFVFIVLHLRISVLPASVSAKTEEYLILIFYVGSLLTEVQQYRTSQSRVYLRWQKFPILSFYYLFLKSILFPTFLLFNFWVLSWLCLANSRQTSSRPPVDLL